MVQTLAENLLDGPVLRGTERTWSWTAWLTRHPRAHMHFTPTYSSWINQVERWFALITERAIRRDSFTSVRQLKQQIELFVQRHNVDTTPFKWVATAESILHKVGRIAKRISATGH